MVILGVDPGTATTGFAVIGSEGGNQKLLDLGVVSTEKQVRPETRLLQIFNGLSTVISKWKADELALESVFFNTNAKTAILIGQSSGVIKLAAAKVGLPVFEYTPLQVKMALTGYGRAEKSQIGKAVQKTFKLKTVPKPDDAADAVAIGLCHCFSRKMKVFDREFTA